MMQTVRLLGDLADRYGEEHEYHNLRTPAEAVKLLCINKPELMKELADAHEHGIGYRIIQGGVDLDYDDLTLPLGSNELILVPVIAGSGGGGLGKILIGVALVALSFVSFGAAGGLFAGGVLAGAAGSVAVASIGASLILSGVSQLISPQPQLSLLGGDRFGSAESTSTDGPQSIVRGSDGRQSYAYTGAANTVGVGATIPVAYGEVLIGSNLLSATVDVADESDPLKAAVKTPGANTVLFGGEKLTYAITKSSGVKARRTNGGFPSGSGADSNNTLNREIALFRGNNRSLGQIDKERSECAVVLEINNGLYDFASGPGSTLVDGFISYKLITETKLSGPDTKTGTSQATIQGLLLPGQVYRWVHFFENQKIENDKRGIKINIEILDFAAAPSSGIQLVVRSAGFT